MIIGTDTAGYIEVHPMVPYGDAHTETMAAESVSILGRTTRNVLRYRRAWQVQTAPLDDRGLARLQVLRRVGGPYWLYDDTLTDLTPRDVRLLRVWKNGATALVPTTGLQLPVAAGVTATAGDTTTVDVSKLIPVVAGEQLSMGVTLQAVAGSSAVAWGARWYRANGTLLSTSTITPTATTTATRFVFNTVAPPPAAYAMWTVTPVAAITLTAPSVLPGSGVDAGGGWFAVHMLDLAEVHHNPMLHSASLSLQET